MKTWAPDEEKCLIDIYPNTNIKTLIERFNRSSRAIENKASKMGLRKSKQHIENHIGTMISKRKSNLNGINKIILEELYIDKNMSMKDISKSLDISIGSVYNLIRKYDIKTRNLKEFYKDKEIKRAKYIWDGYVMVYVSDKDNPEKKYYVKEHRYIMEQHLGRKLEDKEVVHHINFDTKDNRLENLMLFPNQSEHKKFHAQLKRLKRLEEKLNA